MKKILITILYSVCLLSFNIPVYADITTGLASYWNFDEGSGTSVADGSGNSNTGTFTNAFSWTTGKLGPNAIYLNSTDYVTVEHSSSLNISGNITIAAWIKPESNGSYQVIAGKPVNGSFHIDPYYSYALQGRDLGAGFQPGFHISTGGVYQQAWSSESVTYGTWVYVVGVYNGSNIKIYVNGVERGSTNKTGTIDTQSTQFRISASGNYTEKFKGTIDELRVYNRAVSTGDISELYALTSDTAAPAISSVASSTSSTTATVTWTTNESATSTVDYGATTSYGTASSSAALVTSHSMALSGLTPSTLYHFRVSSADAAGNRATSTDYTFTTAAAPDTAAPVPDVRLILPMWGSSSYISHNLNQNTKTGKYIFIKNLTLKSRGSEVVKLQQFLNNNGYMVALKGAGSPGFESNYFGPATRRALARFQADNDITPSVGFFGSITREKLNR
ncbi:peptidoglycan-binding protein [Candidatus Parcubacteria bacterium]|nr:peptidoglycan-binding protein [Candidatus Parcubacteria bacterium]